MHNHNPRRSFFKQTGAAILSFKAVDLIPNVMAQAPGCNATNADSACATPIAGGAGNNKDQHCVPSQTGPYDNDGGCSGAAANGSGYDEDGVCGKNTGPSIGGQPISDPDAGCNTGSVNNMVTNTDQDGSCGKQTGSTGAYDGDEACNDGNSTVNDVDQNCRVLASYDKDESCVSANNPGSQPDEACGYLNGGQRDVDQHCYNATDPDNSYS